MKPLVALLGLLAALGLASAEVVIEPTAWKPKQQIQPGQTVSQQFVLTNQGDQPVKILSATGSNDINLTLERQQIAPHKSIHLTASIVRAEVQRGFEGVKGDIALMLDGAQDRVNVPVELTFVHGKAEAAKPKLAHYQPRPGDQPVVADFFFDSACGKCQDFLEDTLRPMITRYKGSQARIVVHDVRMLGELEQLNRAKQRYQVKPGDNTYAFIGSHVLVGKETIGRELDKTLQAELQHPTSAPLAAVALGGPEGPGRDGSPATARAAGEITVPLVLAAGLGDGINPCAIATAIFLVVMLTRLGHDRRVVITAGASYTLAVFVTYFLVGVGLLASLKWVVAHSGLAKALNLGVAALALGAAALQVADVVRFRRGGATRDMTMQMPLRLKQMAHGYLREGLSRPAVAAGAFAAGVLVTLLEAVCTGQLYVPVLTAMLNTPALARSLSLLCLYNLGFVLPMVVILVLTYRGITSEALAQTARRHLVPAKLALAALLFVLGGYLVLGTVHRSGAAVYDGESMAQSAGPAR